MFQEQYLLNGEPANWSRTADADRNGFTHDNDVVENSDIAMQALSTKETNYLGDENVKQSKINRMPNCPLFNVPINK